EGPRHLVHERVAHSRAGPVGEDVEPPRLGRLHQQGGDVPDGGFNLHDDFAYGGFIHFLAFFGGGSSNRAFRRSSTEPRSGLSSMTGAVGSVFMRFMRAGRFAMVNCRGSRPVFTSFHVSGAEAGPPGSGRALYGATSRRPCPFWRKSR